MDTEVKGRDDQQYWATLPPEKLVAFLEDRIKAWYNYVQTSGLIALWRRAHRTSYGGQLTGGQLGTAGDNDEYTTLGVNHYNNLKQHILTMVTGQRQYFESKAANADHASQAQTIIANSLIETVMREKDLESVSQTCVDLALQHGEGWCHKVWDWDEGPSVATEAPPVAQTKQDGPPKILPDQEEEPSEAEQKPEERPRKAGDIKYYARMSLDVVRDYNRDAPNTHDWFIVRVPANRWDLIAKHPDLREEILKAPSKLEQETDCPRLVRPVETSEQESDEIWVWEFYHRKSPALPEGRMVAFLGAECVLFEDGLRYREMPLYRIAAQDVVGTSFGYTSLFDLLALQQMLDGTVSTVVSNLAAFGVQNIWVPDGAGVTVEELKGGLKVISGGGAKPEPLNLFSLPPEVIKFIDLLERWLETLSGVNSVARGNPEASLKSGSALALVQSQAIQFLALIQKAYIKFLENVSTGTVKDFQEFGDAPHILTVTGKDKRQYIREFTKKDIADVARVQVQVGNPLSGTIAGRVNMVEQLGNLGLIETPEQYFQVMQTGRLEPATESVQAELMLVKGENEMLSRGESPVPIMYENHPLHMKEHQISLASTDARRSPEVVRATLQHIAEHAKLWREADPELLMILGVKPPQMPAQNAQDAQQTEAKQQGMSKGDLAQPQPPMPGKPAPGTAMPRQPSMPRNAMTGERAAPPVSGAPPAP